MNDEAPSFTLRQDFDIAQPASTRAFPITNQEWILLKESIENISDSNTLFHTLGSALIGAGLSTLIAIWLTTFNEAQGAKEVLMWAAAVVCLVCGAFSCYFAHKEKEVTEKSCRQVISQMQVIENRYGVDLTSQGSGTP